MLGMEIESRLFAFSVKQNFNASRFDEDTPEW